MPEHLIYIQPSQTFLSIYIPILYSETFFGLFSTGLSLHFCFPLYCFPAYPSGHGWDIYILWPVSGKALRPCAYLTMIFDSLSQRITWLRRLFAIELFGIFIFVSRVCIVLRNHLLTVRSDSPHIYTFLLVTHPWLSIFTDYTVRIVIYSSLQSFVTDFYPW